MKLGVICQSCGVEAPSKYVEFHQNIGALFMRFHKSFKGDLCKRCLHERFWTMTSITLAIGWLGIISIIVAPIFVINNIVRYLGALGMPAVPAGARQPQINEEIFSRFLHRSQEVFQRVQAGEEANEVARQVSPEIGLTPGQVLKCMVTLVQHQQTQQQLLRQQHTGGFPVIHREAQLAQEQV